MDLITTDNGRYACEVKELALESIVQVIAVTNMQCRKIFVGYDINIEAYLIYYYSFADYRI